MGANGLHREQMPVRGFERMRDVPKNSMRSRQRPWNGQPDSRIRRCRNKCYSIIYKSRGAFLHVRIVLPDITNLVPGGRSTTEKSRWRKIGSRTKKLSLMEKWDTTRVLAGKAEEAILSLRKHKKKEETPGPDARCSLPART